MTMPRLLIIFRYGELIFFAPLYYCRCRATRAARATSLLADASASCRYAMPMLCSYAMLRMPPMLDAAAAMRYDTPASARAYAAISLRYQTRHIAPYRWRRRQAVAAARATTGRRPDEG